MNKEAKVKKEENHYALEEKGFNQLVNYLAMKPYAEVIQLIQLLQRARVVKIENEEEGKK